MTLLASPPRRLFLALWPPPGVAEALATHAGRWQWPEAARRTANDRLHVTLHYIGDVPMAGLPRLQQALPRGWEGCTLRLDHAEVWRGGIAVLEALQVPAPLAGLHARLADVLRAQGLRVEERRFRPHVTLARHAQGARPPDGFEPLAWQVAPRYLLVRSLPGGRGYPPVQCFG
ncbi:RNA 2',3'-cyclic phosphodiesterase [Ramlibacter terrae]|uniref:RNA 2',3'-cyclic phosphodiesterase n=1 Tax=Ramlibacter terrae TaxID=2732511 RepID=A0ABX6P2N4_9BURK|nr:RNA 2',3'-cyclic phosphodiesterase [Ramlibacter terrae]